MQTLANHILNIFAFFELFLVIVALVLLVASKKMDLPGKLLWLLDILLVPILGPLICILYLIKKQNI